MPKCDFNKVALQKVEKLREKSYLIKQDLYASVPHEEKIYPLKYNSDILENVIVKRFLQSLVPIRRYFFGDRN